MVRRVGVVDLVAAICHVSAVRKVWVLEEYACYIFPTVIASFINTDHTRLVVEGDGDDEKEYINLV